MEKNYNEIEREVEKTLALLEDKVDLKVNPYFYTILIARIEGGKPQAIINRFKIAYILPVMLGILLLFNIITLVFKVETKEISQTTRSEYVEDFVKEYLFFSF